MQHVNSGLGGRLPLLDPKSLVGEQAELYQTLKTKLVTWAEESGFKGQTPEGELIGPFNPYLYSTGITPGFLAWMAADKTGTTLDKRVHEIVILSVGAVWRSPYELYAHSAVARKVGVPEAAIQALVAGEHTDELTPAEQAARRFATQLASERRVDKEIYGKAERFFGKRGLVDMVYLVGLYLLTCALLNAFEIPSPE